MSSLIESLQPGTTVVTVNRRLARALHAAYGERQRAQGHGVWESPDILPLAAWVDRCWRELEERGEVEGVVHLQAAQECALWERLIADDPAAAGASVLLRASAAADLAREAYALLHEYGCTLRELRAPAGGGAETDLAAFVRWGERYASRLAQRGWLDGAGVRACVLEALGAGRVELPARLVLAGFDLPTPYTRALVDALAARGVGVAHWRPPGRAARVRRIRFDEAREELEAAAQWARANAPATSADCAEPIGVVVPDLGAQRARVERIFTEAFCPGADLPGTAEHVPAFEISLGRPLGEVPLVRHALAVLGLARTRIPLTDLAQLLRSPYLRGAEAERSARALFDAALRARAAPEIALPGLTLALAERAADRSPWRARLPVFGQSLERFERCLRATPRRQSAAGWAATFAAWLQALGWPGERPRASGEQQAFEAFHELLAEYSDLEAVLPAADCAEACARLRRMAAERIFQPAGGVAAVQVMGMLETAGTSFSQLWVSGLHDGVWPGSPGPNPFLPRALQRRLDMPHASPERELAFARQVTERLLGSAREVIVSHAARAGDEELRASPLIGHLPEAPIAALGLAPHAPLHRRIAEAAPALETFLDPCGPALAEPGPVAGGARVVQDQAACPFRAFARYRLGARALDEPAPGFDARLRGILVHQVCDALWAELGSHARLLAMDAATLGQLVEQVVHGVLTGCTRLGSREFSPRARRLEQQRLVALTTAWLEVERGRAPFEVFGRECEQSACIGGLTLTLRLDRVDRLADGRLVLIDYKTGRANLSGWFGARPDEPQLPLYCLAAGEAVGAVAFASLRTDDLGFRGLAAVEGLAPGIKSVSEHNRGAGREHAGWPELRAAWAHALAALGAAFLRGDARVDPKTPKRTCERCDVQPLCRVHEHALAEEQPGARLGDGDG